MRRIAMALFLASGLALSSFLIAEDRPKDSALADKTRTVLLKTKITVEFENKPLKECMSEISGELEGMKLGRLASYPSTGVSMNTRYTYKAKDKPIEDILNEMLKTNDLGYIITSKQGDRYDGWLKLTKGNERGYELSADDTKGKDDTKKKDSAKKDKTEKMEKDEPKKKDTAKKDDTKKADTSEKDAATLLEAAETLTKAGKTKQAKDKLDELMKKYPDSKAAEQAKKMTEK